MAAWGKRLGFALGIGGAAVGTGWVADGLAGVFGALSEWPTGTTNPMLQIAGWVRGICWKSETTGQALWLLIGMAVLLGSLLLLFRLRHGIIIPRARMLRTDSIVGHHTVIMGLSPRDEDATDNTEHLRVTPFRDVARTETDLKAVIASLEADTATEADKARAAHLRGLARHPWQQPLRMIWRHVDPDRAGEGHRLERIIVVPSLGHDPAATIEKRAGSVRCAEAFKALLVSKMGELDPPADVSVRIAHPVRYENLEETADALLNAVRDARRDHTHRHRGRRGRARGGICVDVTAGFKPFSIAAALVTMNEDLIFGYVDTDGQPKFYDARVEVAASFGE